MTVSFANSLYKASSRVDLVDVTGSKKPFEIDPYVLTIEEQSNYKNWPWKLTIKKLKMGNFI